jgi:hypothetical protein
VSTITLTDALFSGRGVERPFNCPSHEDTHASASVNVAKGVWFCYSCMAHGVIENHVPTVEEAIRILNGSAPARVFPESYLDLFDADFSSPYWVSRVGYDIAAANRCGTNPFDGAPTYPVRDSEGRLLGVVGRYPDSANKYRYPYNVSTARTLYGTLRPCVVLVLVEGAGDVMALQQAAAQMDERFSHEWVYAGLYGSGVHHPQVGLIASLNPKLIVTASDDDKAGRLANARAKGVLEDIAPVVSHPWSRFGGKDAAEVQLPIRIPSLLDTLTQAGFARFT